jgi:hypothetical protein
MRRPRLVQVCNVGQLTGGTGACAWTVTRALPGFEHIVVFPTAPTDETRAGFTPSTIVVAPRVTTALLREWNPAGLLLHNSSAERIATALPRKTLLYQHSAARGLATGGGRVVCSQWLADRLGWPRTSVLWQAVPRPLKAAGVRSSSTSARELVLGRLCTPIAQKWPSAAAEHCAALTAAAPHVRWEFVGCPESLQAEWSRAVAGRCRFFPASWSARSRYWRWDALLYHNPQVTESFGRTVAEAMRAGCVPIVDDRGGFIEQLADGGGALCRTLDDFLAAVERLHDPVQRTAWSATARTIADERWSLARFAQDLLARFDAL